MERAVIVREGAQGQSTRTGVVDRAIAEAMALKGWIAAPTSARITRYHITAAGRSALADMMARNESAYASGLTDAETGEVSKAPRRIRYGLAESPLAALARRRDREGERFLSDDLVHAGERLREDFEMAQMEDKVAGYWEQFLVTLRIDVPASDTGISPSARRAHARVVAALREIGPGLSESRCGVAASLRGWKRRKRRWVGRRGRARLC